jgi:hypothetical protein
MGDINLIKTQSEVKLNCGKMIKIDEICQSAMLSPSNDCTSRFAVEPLIQKMYDIKV